MANKFQLFTVTLELASTCEMVKTQLNAFGAEDRQIAKSSHLSRQALRKLVMFHCADSTENRPELPSGMLQAGRPSPTSQSTVGHGE